MATEDVMNANRSGPRRWVLGLAVFLPGVLAVRADEGLKVRAVLEGGQFRVASLAFSPDGKTLAAGHKRLWDVASAKETDASANFRGVKGGRAVVAFSPDGKTLAAAAHTQ